MVDEKQNTSTENITNDASDNIDEDEAVTGTGSGSDGGIGNATSPDAVINFIIAGVFDLIGLIPVVNMVSAIIAGIYFVIWMIATGKKGWWKLILALILMFIPVVSDFAAVIGLTGLILGIKIPSSWTGFVYSTVTTGGFSGKTSSPATGGKK